jgi:hypothetical protein
MAELSFDIPESYPLMSDSQLLEMTSEEWLERWATAKEYLDGELTNDAFVAVESIMESTTPWTLPTYEDVDVAALSQDIAASVLSGDPATAANRVREMLVRALG